MVISLGQKCSSNAIVLVLLVLPMVGGIDGYAWSDLFANVLLGVGHSLAVYNINAVDSRATVHKA